MATKEQTTYGYLSDDTGPLTSAKECQVALTANNQEQITLLNENGVSDGTITGKVTSKMTVPVGQVEQQRTLVAFLTQKTVRYRYAVGAYQITIEGKISTCNLGSAANQANSFDFELAGFVLASQFDA